MRRQRVRSTFAIATLLAMLIVSLTASPAAAGAQRIESLEKLSWKLVNCLRTGGKVTATGYCKAYGTGKYAKYRPPLKRSKRISKLVAYPWAKRTAVANICGHTLAGSTVTRRFREAGFRHPENGENVGCGASGWSTRRMVVTVLRWWQDERAYNGSHWRQIRDKDFKSAGVAVVKLGNGRSRLVVNFYGRAAY